MPTFLRDVCNDPELTFVRFRSPNDCPLLWNLDCGQSSSARDQTRWSVIREL